MIRLFRNCLLAFLVAALAIVSVANPWTAGRGPGNQGSFPDVNFPQAPAVVWKSFLGNDFRNLAPSNTLVAADTVIVAYDKYLLALSTKTGEPRWKYDLYAPPLGDMLLLDGKVIVSTQQGFVFAIDPETGKLLWRCKLTDSIRNSPVLLDSLLLYTTKSNTIEAVDVKGTLDNKRVTVLIRGMDKIEAAPVKIGKSFLLCYTDGSVMRLEENGIVRWSIKLPNSVLGLTPATDGKIAIVSTANAVYAVDPFEQIKQKAIRWSYACPDRVSEPAILDGNRVYVATRGGELRAIDAATGKDVWTRTETNGTKKMGVLLPSIPVGQPVALGQHLLVRMEYGLIALYQKDDGALAWMYKLIAPVGMEAPKRYFAGVPAVDGNDIYFAGSDTMIYRLSESARDTEPPTFTWTLPMNTERGYVTPSQLQYVGAVIADEGAGLHAGLVQMKLDEVDLTPQVRHDAQTGFFYAVLNPARPLDFGLHQLTITAKDYRGNVGTQNQSFIVAPPNADYVEVQIGGEFLPKRLQVRPGTVICWRNAAGGPRTVISESDERLLKFSSDPDYPEGIPDKERWVWIVPEDAEPDTYLFYYCRLQGKPGDGEQIGSGLAAIIEIVEHNPVAFPANPRGPVEINPDATPPWADRPVEM